MQFSTFPKIKRSQNATTKARRHREQARQAQGLAELREQLRLEHEREALARQEVDRQLRTQRKNSQR